MPVKEDGMHLTIHLAIPECISLEKALEIEKAGKGYIEEFEEEN